MADMQEQQIKRATSLIVEAIKAGAVSQSWFGGPGGVPTDQIEKSVEPAVRYIVEASALESLKRLRIALRSLSEQEHRSERERTLLLDLVEELGGEAAG